MANSLQDLNQHLFDQMARLSNSDMDADEIETEVARTEAMVSVSDQVLKNADLSLKAAKLYAEHGNAVLPHLPQIGKAEE